MQGNLTFLESSSVLSFRNLSTNYLTGIIPSQIVILHPHFKAFLVAGSSITKHIPATLGNITTMVVLSSRDNNLDGSISDNLGNHSDLQLLCMLQPTDKSNSHFSAEFWGIADTGFRQQLFNRQPSRISWATPQSADHGAEIKQAYR
ncbi:hypothetical protein SUGI_0178020 [Cryptomeria japonica]|nr:hypothetical protein SUGI_0178020 [Cryptomeria japonica]